MRPRAIAYRDCDGCVVVVISVDRQKAWATTAEANREGYDVLYR